MKVAYTDRPPFEVGEPVRFTKRVLEVCKSMGIVCATNGVVEGYCTEDFVGWVVLRMGTQRVTYPPDMLERDILGTVAA